MRLSFRTRRVVPFLLLSTLFVAGLSALAVSQHWFGRRVTAAPSVATAVAAPAVVTAQVDPRDLQGEIEQVTLRPYGFEPRAIKRPRGEFLLSLTNRSRQKDLALQLFRVVGASKGEKLKDVGLPKGVVNRLTTLSLQPGEYVLSEASNPRWECRLTITAQ